MTSGQAICWVVFTLDVACADFGVALFQKGMYASEDLVRVMVSAASSLPAFYHSHVVPIDPEGLTHRLQAYEYGDEKLEAYCFCPANIFPI